MIRSKIILPIIVLSQFCCTSLWFAGNGVMSDLVIAFSLPAGSTGHLTSSVQFGFIVGTLLFAILTIADRFSPSKVFFISAILGAFFNLTMTYDGNGFASILVIRFLTGFFLAGIYPVGMKIAADYFDKGLGKSLGLLVGALVLGTAFPHLLKDLTSMFHWKSVIFSVSGLALIGGLTILILVPDGPFRKPSQAFAFSAFIRVFKIPKFRAAASGYFGHMWELYAFWAFVPIILKMYAEQFPDTNLNVPLYSFIIIGGGGLACVIGGYLSQFFGVKRMAAVALFLSGVCCVLSPFLLSISAPILIILFLIFWGMVVVADSPLFSTLVAQNAPIEFRGTSLTIVNCIGFAVTIISIQLINVLVQFIDVRYVFLALAFGPALGLLALLRERN